MPENENNKSPKKKRGFLWVIIVILVVVLAAVIGGYALSQYYGMPAWLSHILPGEDAIVAPTASVEGITVVSPTPAPVQTPQAEEAEEPAQTEPPETTDMPAPTVTAMPTIGADAAAEVALKHSGISEKDADIWSVLLVEQNGMMLYEVCFSTGETEYAYYLDASTGRVESWRKASMAEDTVEPAVSASAEAKATENSASGNQAPEKSATVLVGEEEAKQLAMGHANISTKDLSRISCKLELDGLSLIYDIEMQTGLMKYEYEIDAISGEIIGFDIAALKK